MIGPIWLPRLTTASIAPLVALLFLFSPAEASAQTVGPNEAVNAEGSLSQHLRLTDAQKAAIYNAVLQQRVRNSATIPVAVGASVSPVIELAELPGQAMSEDSLAMDLKYAMVEHDVVVVDPVRMRVVEVIHGAKP
jgi:hypothetical protein